MVTLVLTEVARLFTVVPITNRSLGIAGLPLPGPLRLFGLTIIPDFAGSGMYALPSTYFRGAYCS